MRLQDAAQAATMLASGDGVKAIVQRFLPARPEHVTPAAYTKYLGLAIGLFLSKYGPRDREMPVGWFRWEGPAHELFATERQVFVAIAVANFDASWRGSGPDPCYHGGMGDQPPKIDLAFIACRLDRLASEVAGLRQNVHALTSVIVRRVHEEMPAPRPNTADQACDDLVEFLVIRYHEPAASQAYEDILKTGLPIITCEIDRDATRIAGKTRALYKLQEVLMRHVVAFRAKQGVNP